MWVIEPHRLGCFVNETHLIEILYWSNFQWISSFNKNTLNETMKKYSAIFKESKFIQFQNRGHCTIAVGTALQLKAVLYSYRHCITTESTAVTTIHIAPQPLCSTLSCRYCTTMCDILGML
jgi:hypothetical protein